VWGARYGRGMEAPRWTLRVARESDVPALGMLSTANRIYHAQVDPSVGSADLAGRRDRYRALCAADNALVLVGEAGEGSDEPVGMPIACFSAIFYPPGPHRPARAYVEDVFVVQRWRRRGLLAAMVARMLERCRKEGIARVDVDYLADNPAGVAAWTALGFAPRSVSATATVDELAARLRGAP